MRSSHQMRFFFHTAPLCSAEPAPSSHPRSSHLQPGGAAEVPEVRPVSRVEVEGTSNSVDAELRTG